MQNEGHIVTLAASESQAQQLVAREFQLLGFRDHAADVCVPHHPAEAIGADEDPLQALDADG